MEHGPRIPNASVILARRGDMVLAVSRRGAYANLGLPGGKIDLGETPREAAVRELYEETGLEPRSVSVFPVFIGEDRSEGRTVFVVTCYEAIIDPRTVPRATEPDTWVGFVHLFRLLDERCTFHAYNRALFQHLRLIA